MANALGFPFTRDQQPSGQVEKDPGPASYDQKDKSQADGPAGDSQSIGQSGRHPSQNAALARTVEHIHRRTGVLLRVIFA
jgi:hypothetical protein